MADRTLVRQGPVVSRERGHFAPRALVLTLGTALTLLAAGWAAPPPQDAAKKADAPAPKPSGTPPPASTGSGGGTGIFGKAKKAAKDSGPPMELKPYRIRAWLIISPLARIDRNGRAMLIEDWKAIVRRFVGAPWQLEVADGDGPLLGHDINTLTPEAIKPLAKGTDKVWVITINPDGDELVLTGRPYDTLSEQLGLESIRIAPVAADAPRGLLHLSLDLFSPTATLGRPANNEVPITVQGSSLAPAHPIGQVVSPGTVFRVSRLYFKPDGGLVRIDSIKNTYLRAIRIEGPTTVCKTTTALRGDPFTRMIVGKFQVVALGVKPASVSTRLRFLTPPPDRRPAAGYTLTARPAPDGTQRFVGTTDREGRVVLPPNFARSLTILRLVAADIEPLVEFPLMPGEQTGERTIVIDPKPSTLTLESQLSSLRDEIVDLVAVRARLEKRMAARADGQRWEEVKALLDQYQKLPAKDQFDERVKKLEADAMAEQNKTKRAVRTRTANAMLKETQALITRYLNDEEYTAYENAWKEYQQQEVEKKTKGAAKGKSAIAAQPAPSPAPKSALPTKKTVGSPAKKGGSSF